MNNVQEVPFRVSARTARLIGRENVATAESAISELVKNSYDADASFCIVRISPTYTGVPEKISKDEFDRLADWGLNPENHYDLSGETANLRPCLADEHSPEAELIRNLVTITVIDDGAGIRQQQSLRWLLLRRWRNWISQRLVMFLSQAVVTVRLCGRCRRPTR